MNIPMVFLEEHVAEDCLVYESAVWDGSLIPYARIT